MAKLDLKEQHWTEVEDVTAGLPGVRSFRPMTEDEVKAYNKEQDEAEVQPADVKLPEALT